MPTPSAERKPDGVVEPLEGHGGKAQLERARVGRRDREAEVPDHGLTGIDRSDRAEVKRRRHAGIGLVHDVIRSFGQGCSKELGNGGWPEVSRASEREVDKGVLVARWRRPV